MDSPSHAQRRHSRFPSRTASLAYAHHDAGCCCRGKSDPPPTPPRRVSIRPRCSTRSIRQPRCVLHCSHLIAANQAMSSERNSGRRDSPSHRTRSFDGDESEGRTLREALRCTCLTRWRCRVHRVHHPSESRVKVCVHVGLRYWWIHGWLQAPSGKEDRAHEKSFLAQKIMVLVPCLRHCAGIGLDAQLGDSSGCPFTEQAYQQLVCIPFRPRSSHQFMPLQTNVERGHSTPSNEKRLHPEKVENSRCFEETKNQRDETSDWPCADPIFITPSWFSAPPGRLAQGFATRQLAKRFVVSCR